MSGKLKVSSRLFAARCLLLLLSASSGQAAPTSPPELLAQAGSTGGTLGNDDKSASGVQSAPPVKKSVKAPAPARTPVNAHPASLAQHPRGITRSSDAAPPEPTPIKRSTRQGDISLAVYDGTWSGASTGACIPRWAWSFTVVNGIMTGDSGSNISGRIRPDGGTIGKMVVFGSTYDFVGRMSATRVSGTWVKLGEDRCSGTWSATK